MCVFVHCRSHVKGSHAGRVLGGLSGNWVIVCRKEHLRRPKLTAAVPQLDAGSYHSIELARRLKRCKASIVRGTGHRT